MAIILVVDDELGIRALLSEILADEGHTVELAENAAQARRARERKRPDLVLLDIWMPDVDGVTLLKEWSASGQLTMPVIMMSGHGTIDTAVEATKVGATAFLEKPITLQKLLRAVEQALSKPAARLGLGPGPGPGRERALPGSSLSGRSPAYGPPVGASAGTAGNSFGSADVTPEGPYGTVVEGSAHALAGGYGSGGMQGERAHYGRQSHSGMLEGPRAEQSFDLDRPLREARDAFEKSYFEFHLAKEGGSMTRVAEKTGLERTHLYRKLKQLGVDLSRNKRGAG